MKFTKEVFEIYISFMRRNIVSFFLNCLYNKENKIVKDKQLLLIANTGKAFLVKLKDLIDEIA